MADRILIRDLRLRCLIGIHPEEREIPQELCIQVTLYTDIRKAARSDFIGDAVDYQKVTDHIVSFTETSRRLLLETFIEDMAHMILRNFAAVEAVHLRVEKPAALPLAQFAGIEIERSRKDFGM
jgi:dihydroneopterin aldolase